MRIHNFVIDSNVIKNILYMSIPILLFIIGIVLYGVVINLREVSLKEAVLEKKLGELNNISFIVDRAKYRLELYSGPIFVKSYKAVFGRNTKTVKSSSDDNVTPLGEYFICEIDTNYEYYKFFKLSYPNKRDASEAYKNGYITKSELELIIDAVNKKECSPAETSLSANIGIHGMGKYNFIFKNLPFIFNWTNGSIAVSDESIDELYPLVKIGTKVTIMK
ncbi:murein L,D-transpeptidase family protein [Bacteroidota bacterium]